ncbi:MAG: adenylate/guanylate cyclase domain-containing protein [Gammaproteobacteria bacterium]|nr:adenylate/guanylate cyclase domain-containing protein [Gammaproteobacteria bacterium]
MPGAEKEVGTAPQGVAQGVVMLADIVGSTALYESCGDTRARTFLAEVIQAMTGIITEQGGRVVAEFGDELMCIFPDPRLAAVAACALHENISHGYQVPGADERQRLHIGMHFGDLPEGEPDMLGEVVRLARWAAMHAKPDQTLVTAEVIERLPPMFRAVSRYIDDETWDAEGDARVALFEIIWDVDAATVAGLPAGLPPKGPYVSVRLEHDGRRIRLDAEHPVLSVGRHPGNDLVISHELVSRQHFTLQFGRGRCTITDRSTNGITVIAAVEKPQLLQHDTAVLAERGQIHIGHKPDQTPAVVLTWVCE